MCGGASDSEKGIGADETAFYKNLTNQYSTVFGQNQAITGALTSAFTPILAAGPGQTGFTPSETNSLNTTAAENIGTNYAQAQRATAQALAGRGGGNTLLPDSVSANMVAANTREAAQQRSLAQNQIVQNNYAQGRQNWLSAANSLGGVANILNPTSYASPTISAGSNAFGAEDTINNSNNSLWKTAIGALGSVAGQAVGGLDFGKMWGSWGKQPA
jgi:hypothetical protein